MRGAWVLGLLCLGGCAATGQGRVTPAAPARPLIDAVLEAYSNDGAMLAPGGERLVFLSDREGSSQVYLAERGAPSAPPLRLSTLDERVLWAGFAQDGQSVLYSSDRDADELFRLYRVGLDGKDRRLLTPAPNLQHDGPLLPRQASDRFVYLARSFESSEARLYVQRHQGGEAELRYTDPGPSSLLDVSEDGQQALVLRMSSAAEAVLLRVELDSGQAQRLYPAPGARAQIRDAAFSADERRVLVATDEGSEHSVLLALDARSGKERARYHETLAPHAAIADLEVSPTGGPLVVAIDAGNRDEVRLLDPERLTLLRTLERPVGAVRLGTFSVEGDGFTLDLDGADRPSDSYWVSLASGRIQPLRAEVRPGLEGLTSPRVEIQQVTATDGLSIPVNVYRPAGVQGRLPVVVMVHGGPAWSSRVQWKPAIAYLLSLGMAVVEPNIRGSTGFGRAYELADNREKRTAALEDLAAVNQWLRGQGWADPQRLVIYGGSYGGYMTLMALTRQPQLWRAGVDICGMSDLRRFLGSTTGMLRAFMVEEFGDPEVDGALLDSLSPQRDRDQIVAPLFVYQGANDPRVPRGEADGMVAALSGRGVRAEYMLVENEGHGIGRRETWKEFLVRLTAFLEQSLATSRTDA